MELYFCKKKKSTYTTNSINNSVILDNKLFDKKMFYLDHQRLTTLNC